MLIEGNTLKRIDPDDIIDGVFISPDEVLYIGNNLVCSDVVKMVLPNVIEIGSDFLFANKTLKYLEIPKVEKIGDFFLYFNTVLHTLLIPGVIDIGFSFMRYNEKLSFIDMPNIKEIGGLFLYSNTKFNYTSRIIKALKGEMYIGGEDVDKHEYLRKLNISKIIC